jgi:WD40 repeat protein
MLTLLFRDESGKPVRLLTEAGRDTNAAAVSPDGKRVAVLSDKVGMPHLYDVATGRQILSLHGIQGGLSMSWSPDGLILAVACKDGYVDLIQAPPATTQATDDKRLGQSPGR